MYWNCLKERSKDNYVTVAQNEYLMQIQNSYQVDGRESEGVLHAGKDGPNNEADGKDQTSNVCARVCGRRGAQVRFFFFFDKRRLIYEDDFSRHQHQSTNPHSNGSKTCLNFTYYFPPFFFQSVLVSPFASSYTQSEHVGEFVYYFMFWMNGPLAFLSWPYTIKSKMKTPRCNCNLFNILSVLYTLSQYLLRFVTFQFRLRMVIYMQWQNGFQFICF